MHTVLVTGVNGFVGQHLARELKTNEVTIIGIGGPAIDSRIEDVVDDYKVLDLTDPQAVDGINFSAIDGVIHLAGLAAVGPSFDKPLEYITGNIGMQINLFEAALRQAQHPRFLIISSGSLYDPGADLPLTEQSPVLPNSPYAVSKLGQEQMARYYASRGFEVIIARPFNHFGPGQNPGFIVPDLTQQLVTVEHGNATEILVGNLDAQRDYTDVRDIVRAYRLLLEGGAAGETYNVCSGVAHSGHQILEAVLAQSKAQPSIQKDPAKLRPADNPIIYGDRQKITTQTDWQPEIAFETTIADTVADWRSRAT